MTLDPVVDTPFLLPSIVHCCISVCQLASNHEVPCLLWQDNTTRIELPAVPYGTQGPWAINLWFKPSSEYGVSFQYLYSHNSTQYYNYTAHPYAPNQV